MSGQMKAAYCQYLSTLRHKLIVLLTLDSHKFDPIISTQPDRVLTHLDV